MDKGAEEQIEYISLKQASEISGYHPDYLGYLIRKGKLEGKRIGRTWLTTEEAVLNYLSAKKNKKEASLKKIFLGKKIVQNVPEPEKKGLNFPSRLEHRAAKQFILVGLLSIFLIFFGFVLGRNYFGYSKPLGAEDISTKNLNQTEEIIPSQNGETIPGVVVNIYPQNSSDIDSQIRSVISSLLSKEISSRILDSDSVNNLKY